MNKNILLAVGITILFLGVSINPAIAVNPKSSDNEEDCSICPKVSKLHLIGLKNLLNRVETLNDKLSVISKPHPEVAKRYQELFDRITTLKEINTELKSDTPYPIFCNILEIMVVSTILYVTITSYTPDIVPDIIYYILLIPIFIIGYPVFGIYFALCDDFPDYHPEKEPYEIEGVI